jgi:hypothetical protein
MRRVHITWIKFRIRLNMFIHRSSMTENTARLLSRLVDLENEARLYRIVK